MQVSRGSSVIDKQTSDIVGRVDSRVKEEALIEKSVGWSLE